MANTPNMHRFDRVDAADDPTVFLKILDAQNAVPGIVATREHAVRAIAPAPGQTLLDVGSGTGEVVRDLASRVAPGGRVVGIDASEAMVAEARRRSPGIDNVEFAVGDAMALDFGDESFDAARSERVFQHLSDSAKALAEMIRVVRPGGRVVVVDTDWDSMSIDLGDIELERALVHAGTDRWVNGTSGRRLRRMFHEAGLAGVEATAVPVTLSQSIQVKLPFDPAMQTADRALEVGRITADQHARIADAIKAAQETDGASPTITMFVVVGSKPR